MAENERRALQAAEKLLSCNKGTALALPFQRIEIFRGPLDWDAG
jgi:hypothetical protein